MEDAVRTEQAAGARDPADQAAADAFIAKWQGVTASGLSTSQSFHVRPEPQAVAVEMPKPWPKDPVDQVRAVADVLAASPVPLSTAEIAARFTARGRWKERLHRLGEMLVALGRAQEEGGRFSAL